MQKSRSFRLVCAPERFADVEELLHAQGYVFEEEPFSPCCRRLVEEPRPLGGSLAALFGYVYIQDRSSMLPPLALNPARGTSVLDMCASPGSKTGFLAQLTGSAGFVLGNEPAKPRLATLRANLHALNALHTATCCSPGESIPLADASWDCIQLDPPCSGWGTADKNPKVMKLWHDGKLKPLISLQRRLLAKAYSLLRPGGTLVYSTCTTNVDENEAQVLWACSELGFEKIPLDPFPGFVWEEPLLGCGGTLRVDGEKSAAQGFYIARLRKPGAEYASFSAPKALSLKGDAQILSPKALEAPCTDLRLLPPGGTVAVFGEHVRFLPAQAADCIPPALVWQGALLGSARGGIRLSPRLRALMPETPPRDSALVLESTAELEALLAGRSIETSLPGTEAGLYFKNLPLCRISLKQGRAVCRIK